MNLTISPAPSLRGQLRAPGDRSITVRAVLLGALAAGESIVRDHLVCDDTDAAIRCMRALGVDVAENESGLRVRGRGRGGLRASADALDCGSSGTTMRLLAGLLSGQMFASSLDGSAQLRKRPMRRITEPLARMGANIRDSDGCAPIHIAPSQLGGIEYDMPVASAQVKSALLLAGLFASGETVVREPAPTRDHIERMLRACGVSVATNGREVRLRPPHEFIRPLELRVPADFSSAAFLLVAAAIHPRSQLMLSSTGVNPTRTGLLDALERMGAHIALENERDESGEPTADLAVTSSRLNAIEVGGDMAARMIDEFPVFAVAATQAHGVTVVRDAQELRVKESNRIDGLVAELRKMGARIEATSDGFVVAGPTQLRGAVVDGLGDHRVAMALAVAAQVADGDTTILGADCVAKTYPKFFADWAALA